MLKITSPLSTPSLERRPFRWPAWAREPLLHFIVLGAVLFAVDRFVFVREDDPHTIVVGADVDREAEQLFSASNGRAPSADELAALRRVWLDNEVLYREGIALQVDRGDTAIRERVIFKALSVIDASVALPPVDETTLRGWFERHRVKYDEPARFDFQEAVLPGRPTEASTRAFVATLNAGGSGEAEAGLRVFKGRPLPTLAQSYGPAFAETLATMAPDAWQAVPIRDGWRAIRLDGRAPARPASFEALRSDVLQDWKDATLSEQRSAAVRALAKKYVVREGDR